MVPELRRLYNEKFSREAYEKYIHDLQHVFPGQLDFRIAETPVFIPWSFTEKMFSACNSIIDTISTSDYKKQSARAIPQHLLVPHEDDHPHCIVFDFGVCLNEKGLLEPQLIEMQGFPSLFAWEVFLPEVHRNHFWSPEGYSDYLNQLNRSSYTALLQRIIIDREDPEEVILLEIFPELQKTRVDFHATEALLGIKTVCLTKIIKEGNLLFYLNEGKKTRIKRIYNRVIFDDLFQQTAEVQEKGKIFQEDLDVVWVPHPNWFYRLSKFTLPFISHPFVPETNFLSEVDIPSDLDNYVVKPLFSFAGQGVIIDVTKKKVSAITDPENWILQRKVNYAPAVITPDEPAKVEIRLFYFWEPGAKRPIAANNLARLSKGKMIGVRYNKDKEWVGGSFCLFEKEV